MKIGPSEDGKMGKDLQEYFFWTVEYCAKGRPLVWRYVVRRIGWGCRTSTSLDLEGGSHEFCGGWFHSCGRGGSSYLVQTIP